MNRKGSRDSQATFNGKRQSSGNWAGQNVNLRDFETFEPRDHDSDDSSVVMPNEMKRRFQHDMHLQLDDLDMPSQSMTLSSLSQSQMQGRSARSYLSGSNNQQHQTSLESLVPSIRTNSNLSLSNSQFDTNEKYDKKEDSPGFGRPNELVSVTDELTVSKSDIDENFPPFKNQNRTFADSVINHQLNGLVNIVQPQTDFKKAALLGASKTVDQRQKSRYQEPQYLLGTTADLLDQSDLSDLDLLTRTQISHNLMAIDPNARSRIISLELSQSQITVPSDPSLPPTHRVNNLMKRLVDDASDLTPDSQNSIQWQFKDNPIEQLKQKIKQSNLQKKGRDTELLEALESNQSQIQRANADLKAQNQELLQANQQLTSQSNSQQQQIKDYQLQLKQLQAQQSKPGSDLLRMRALEAARQDNKEMRDTLDQQKSRVSELESLVIQFEQQQQQWASQKDKMDLDREKQSIVIQGLRRELDEVRAQNLDKQQDISLKIDSQSSKLQQAQEELAQLTKALQLKDVQLQETITRLKSKQSKIKQLKMDVTSLESKQHALLIDVADWQARAREQEDIKKPKSSFDQEMQRVKDKHSVQVGKMQDELRRLQVMIGERDAILLQQQSQGNDQNEIEVQSLRAQIESYQLGESKHSKKEQKWVQQEQKYLQQIELLKTQESPSQFTKNLISQKEIEIQNLRQQLEQSEQMKWHSDQEAEQVAARMEQLQSEMHELQREIGGLRKGKQIVEQALIDCKNRLKQQSDRYEELRDRLMEWEPVDSADPVLQRLTDQFNARLEQTIGCQEMIEQQCKRQQEVIKQLESKLINRPQVMDKSVQGDNDIQDVSLIEGNELQEKSGKYEAMMFLQQIGEGEKLEIVHRQLMEELQLKQDEYEIQIEQARIGWNQERSLFEMQLAEMKMNCEKQLRETRAQHEKQMAELKIEVEGRRDLESSQVMRREMQEARVKHERLLAAKETQHNQELAKLREQHERDLGIRLQEWKVAKKEAVDKAVTQTRSELLNKMSELKNEHLRVQAEWQREKGAEQGKLNEQVQVVREELLRQQEDKVKEAKVVVKRMCDKQLQEVQQRLEQERIRCAARVQEVEQKLESERQQAVVEVKRMQKQHWDLKQQCEKAGAVQQEQLSVIKDLESKLAHNVRFVEQLKLNFEQELIQQEQNQQSKETAHDLEPFAAVILSEMDKILITLTCPDKQEVNDKRQQINKIIKSKLAPAMKPLFDQVKFKVSNVLATLKKQLQIKYQQDASVSTVNQSNQSVDVRHSASSSEVIHNSPVRHNLRNSEIGGYVEQLECPDVVSRLQPQQQNSKGAVVVEVAKVVRDLQMLYETTKMAKFCRVLIGAQPESPKSQSTPVQQYRDQLNSFFKLLNRLNTASDQVSQDSEVFRLRLLNVELNQKVHLLQKEQQSVVTRQLVQEVIQFWSQQEGQKVRPVLDSLEHLHFQISKNQFKLNQLCDLFTDSGSVNKDTAEVIAKCEEFTSMDAFLESSFHNNKAVEMMSPNETAQLIATVINQMPSQTVHSDGFIKQALSMVNESMPPLQQPKLHHRLHTQQQSRTISTQRSRSTNNNMPRQMPYQTVEQTRYLSQAETLIQSEEELDNSIVQHQSSLDEELACAQSNVNHLFEKVKGSKFHTLQY